MRYLNLSLISALASISLAARSETRDHQITVNQMADSLSGTCLDESSDCNLRAAIAEAQRLGGRVAIALNVDSIIDQGQIQIASLTGEGDLQLTLKGQNILQNITGNGTSRLFQVDASASLALENVLINKFTAIDGGAIVNNGTVSILASTFRDNKSACFGSGAMTAYASCSGGAISNAGTLILKNGTLFEKNEVTATVGAASFTNSSASGGAIASSGSILFDGSVIFNQNTANSIANSGYHPMPAGGAVAAASGGAIYNVSGSLTVTSAGRNLCAFTQNEALASASTPYGEAVPTSVGGAISSIGGRAEDILSACSFQGNFAQTGLDVNLLP